MQQPSFKTQSYLHKKFKISNSIAGAKTDFVPSDAQKVTFYSCGPTVYGPLHIGNARALFTGDFIYRWLSHIGYNVTFVRNYTDVDDKIINRAKDEGVTSDVIAKRYTDYCEEDMRLMGLGRPTHTVKVTEAMDDIISLIKDIIQRGHGYESKGEVLFAIDTFKEYGKLSGKKVEELQAGARVEVGEYKKNPMDFSLWKKAKEGEPSWESPWGNGRPGWHIECSALIRKWLGDTIDLHHGGQDLIFPHHENEIAQSECGTGKTFCGHWMHNGFLTVGKEKMSKSLGNIFEIRKFIETYGAEILRYQFIRHHYRSAFDFNEEALKETLTELERVYAAKLLCEEIVLGSAVENEGVDNLWISLLDSSQKCLTAMEDELFNDLNSPGAMAAIFNLVRAFNAVHAEVTKKSAGQFVVTKTAQAVAKNFVSLLDHHVKPLMNVFGDSSKEMLAHIGKIRQSLRGAEGSISDADVEVYLKERVEARKNKNFARSDEIRKLLDEKGVMILDSATGTTWKRK